MINKEGWEKKKLGEVCQIGDGNHSSNYPKNSEMASEGIPFIRSNNMVNGNVIWSEMKFITKAKHIILKKGHLKAGDILFTNRGDIGKVAIVGKDFENANLNSQIAWFRCNEIIENKFLFYFLLSPAMKNYYKAEKNGAALQQFTIRQINAIEIPTPKLPIQHQIVSELDTLTDIITKKKQQLSDLDALAQATFYDMFGDPVSNDKGWDVKKLADLGDWASGGTPSRKEVSYFAGEINWYSAGELNSLYLPPSKEKITVRALKESSAKLFKPNSLFIGMYDTAAFKLGITKSDASSNQACANVFPNSRVSIIFLYFILKEMREHFLKMRRGIRQQNLNLGMIKEFKIPIPPLSLQHIYKEKIESIEKQKQLIKKSIADARQLFDYTMDKYFN